MIDQYAVIGNPITHSKSPFIHSEFAKQTDQDLQYIAIEAPIDNFIHTVTTFHQNGGKGASITLPFKQQAFAFVTCRSEQAQLASAVNTIFFKPDGQHYGHNTDGIGLIRDMTVNQRYSLAAKRILVLGASGAVRGVLGPLLAEKPYSLTIVNRTLEKATTLANEFAKLGNVNACSYAELAKQQFDVIINGTSASLNNELPPLPDNIICSAGYCYDMAYSDTPTIFLEWAKQQGVLNYSDGIGMLIEQAAEAFLLWRGIRPDTQPVLKKLKSLGSVDNSTMPNINS